MSLDQYVMEHRLSALPANAQARNHHRHTYQKYRPLQCLRQPLQRFIAQTRSVGFTSGHCFGLSAEPALYHRLKPPRCALFPVCPNSHGHAG